MYSLKMNEHFPYSIEAGNGKMTQLCKVCGEPAAGFHFGAFTCEGCKSFFGRSYNNLSSIQECKNNGACVIDKKNRTSCKACRLRKCLLVGMSKSGSRYGRRSNWFKIHCLLQEQGSSPSVNSSPSSMKMLSDASVSLEGRDYGAVTSPSPSVSSPESHNSDSSVEGSNNMDHYHKIRNRYGIPVTSHSGFIDFPTQFAFPPLGALLPPSAFLPTFANKSPPSPPITPRQKIPSHAPPTLIPQPTIIHHELYAKKHYLDSILYAQQHQLGAATAPEDQPMDLSFKRESTPTSEKCSKDNDDDRNSSDFDDDISGHESDRSIDNENDHNDNRMPSTPLDLRSTKS